MARPTQVLVHNWRLKLSALGLSVLLWALVQSEPTNRETFSSVPVRVQIADSGWTTSGAPSPATVEVGLGGPPREIIRMAQEGPIIRVPVDEITSRDTIITLRRDWVQLGQGSNLTVESLSPSEVRISFEPAQTRLVPVSPRLAGRIRDHLALASQIDVSPQLVRVRGPESRLEGLDSVPLMPFDLSEIQRSGAFNVPVDTAGLLGASVVPPTATLDVRVEELVERVIEGVPVEARTAPGQPPVVVEPSTIQVRLAGARSIISSLDPSRLRVWVPPEMFQDMNPGEDRFLRLQVDGVPALVTAVPSTDRVTVRRPAPEPGRPGTQGSP